MSQEGHNSGEVNGGRLKSYVERLERMQAEIKERQEDVKEIYAEVHSAGYDKKIVRQVVRLRARDPGELEEEEALRAVYLRALGE